MESRPVVLPPPYQKLYDKEELSDSGSSIKEITEKRMNIVERLKKKALLGARDEPKAVNNAPSVASGGVGINATTTTEPIIMSRTAVYRMLREQLKKQQQQKDTFKAELGNPELGNSGQNDVVQNNSGIDISVQNNPELGNVCITAQNPVIKEDETVTVEVAIPVGSLCPIPPMSPSVSQEGIVEQESPPIPIEEPSNPVNDKPSLPSPPVLPVPPVPAPVPVTTPVLDQGLYLTTAYITRSALKPSKFEYLDKPEVEIVETRKRKAPKMIIKKNNNKKMKVSSKKDNNRNKIYRNVGFVPTQLGTVPRDSAAPYSIAGTSRGPSQSVVGFLPTFMNKNDQQSMKGQSGMVKKVVAPVVRAMPVRGSSSRKIILKAIRCKFCEKKNFYLPSRPELVRHLKQIHKLEAFQCPLVECGERFGGKIFSNHIRWQHKGVSSWPCGLCPTEGSSVFARCAQLTDHIRFVHEEGKFACGMQCCPFVGTNELMVEQHFDLVHGDGCYGDDDDALVPADVPMDEPMPMQYQQMPEPMIEQDEEKMDYEIVNQNEDQQQEPKKEEVVVVIKKDSVQENFADLSRKKCPWDGCQFRSIHPKTMAYHIQVSHFGFKVKNEVGDEQTVQLKNADESMNAAEPVKKPEEEMIKDDVMDESNSETVHA